MTWNTTPRRKTSKGSGSSPPFGRTPTPTSSATPGDQGGPATPKDPERADLAGADEALAERHEYFARTGAQASDHGLLEPYGREVKQKRAEGIFRAAYAGKKKFGLRSPETREFISFLMHFFCGMNQERGMATQIHYGALRNANQYLYERWGADVGRRYRPRPREHH